jgi:hypothetical protein
MDGAVPVKEPREAGSRDAHAHDARHDARHEDAKHEDAKREDAKHEDSGKGGSPVEDSGASLFGATTYVSHPVKTTAAEYHSMMGGPGNPGPQMACLSCHGPGMKDTEFLFAGSIDTSVDGGTGAEDIEVRVGNSKGVGTSAYSDSDGNFWAMSTSSLPAGASAGARDSVSEAIMPSHLTSADCNSCHNGTTQPILHLP